MRSQPFLLPEAVQVSASTKSLALAEERTGTPRKSLHDTIGSAQPHWPSSIARRDALADREGLVPAREVRSDRVHRMARARGKQVTGPLPIGVRAAWFRCVHPRRSICACSMPAEYRMYTRARMG